MFIFQICKLCVCAFHQADLASKAFDDQKAQDIRLLCFVDLARPAERLQLGTSKELNQQQRSIFFHIFDWLSTCFFHLQPLAYLPFVPASNIRVSITTISDLVRSTAFSLSVCVRERVPLSLALVSLSLSVRKQKKQATLISTDHRSSRWAP